MVLEIKSPSTFITKVSTISRNSNELRTVKLRVVYKNGFFYLTRRNKDSSWYKNLLKNQYAEIEIDNNLFKGEVSEMVNEKERLDISRIKFNDKRSYEQRYGFRLEIKEKIK